MVSYKAAIFGACTAVAVAATIVTLPIRALAAPFYGPGPVYAPAPAYYAPPPVYYPPPPAYYGPPPPGYYGR